MKTSSTDTDPAGRGVSLFGNLADPSGPLAPAFHMNKRSV